MPSLHDLTDADIEIGMDGPAAPADVLARVKSEGMRRRTRRHRRNSLVAMLGLVAVALPAIALLPGDDPADDVRVAGETENESPATVDRPDGTVPTTVAASVPPTTAVAPPVEPEGDVELGPATQYERPEPTPTTVPPATTPAPVCQNSTDPACGDFRWEPAPAANQPLTAAFVDAPATAAVGEAVSFSVAWSDPDAQLSFDYFSADGVAIARDCAIERRYGPWTPPDAAAGSGELSYSHTFTEAGTYTVLVTLSTADCNSPYSSDRTVETTVTVA